MTSNVLLFNFARLKVNSVFLALCGSFFIAVMAQISVPLAFTPVPITGQTLAVLLIGATFGSRLGAATVLTYLAEGALGLPFFAGSSSGYLVFFGPRGGYLLGFVIAAWAVGKMAESKLDRKLVTAIPCFLIGHFIIFFFGCAWLSTFVGFQKSVILGFFPFVPGEVIKTAMTSLILSSIWKTKIRSF